MHHFYWVIQYFHWPFLRQIFVNVIDDYLRNTCQMSMYTFTIKHFFSDMTKTLLRVVKVETIKSAHKKLNIWMSRSTSRKILKECLNLSKKVSNAFYRTYHCCTIITTFLWDDLKYKYILNFKILLKKIEQDMNDYKKQLWLL